MFKSNVSRKICILVVTSALLLSGCQTGKNQSAKEGVLGGAILGAIVGGLLNGKKGAIAGAVAGGLIGGVVGKEIDSRKNEYASTEEFYDGQLSQTKELNLALAKNNLNMRKSIEEDQNKISALIANYESGKAQNTELSAKKSAIDQKIANVKNRIESLDKELEIQQAVLTEINESDTSYKHESSLSTEVASLEKEIAELNEIQDAMASQSATIGQYI